MKQKYTITIADVQMNIITDEAPEAVETVVGILDRKMREISLKSGNRCPKNEAALLCALDYCAERTKLQETVNKLEAERAGTDVEALNAEITRRGEELEDIAGRLTYSETQREALQNELDSVNSRLREALMSSDGTAAAKAELDTRVAELVEQLREATAMAASEKAEKESAERELAEKEADFNDTLEKLQALIDEKNEKLQALSSKESELSQNLAKTQTELESLRGHTGKEISDKDNRIRVLSAELDTIKSSVERERTARNAERMASGTREDTLRMQLAEVTAKLREFRDDYDSLESGTVQKQAELTALVENEKALRVAAEEALAELQAEVAGAAEEANAARVALEEKLAVESGEKETVKVELASVAGELEASRVREADLEARIVATLEELAAVRAAAESARREQDDLYAELAEKQASTDEFAKHETALREVAERRLAEGEAAVVAAENAANELREKLASFEAEAEEKADLLRAELEEQMEAIRAELNAAREENAQLKETIEADAEASEEAKKNAAELQAKVDEEALARANAEKELAVKKAELAEADGREAALREELNARIGGEEEIRAAAEGRVAEKEAELAAAAERYEALVAELEAVKKEKEDALLEITDKDLALRELTIRENALHAEVEKEQALREVYERKLEAKERTLRELEGKKPAAAEKSSEDSDDLPAVSLKAIRHSVDENQLTIDSAESASAAEEKPSDEVKPLTASDDKQIENEKKKAQKRVRSMFDLITFENV